jgi:3,4-dihydroxy 2-butanone 4-phosphate synthase/GTP cyclohydrolase II
MGDVSNDEPVLVRVHARNLLDDVFSSTRSDCQMPVREAMKLIAENGRGILVIIRQDENNKALAELVHQYQMQDNGVVIPAVTEKSDAWRTTGTGSQILADLGVHKIQVLGPHKTLFSTP